MKSHKVMVLISLSLHYHHSFVLVQPSGQENDLFPAYFCSRVRAHTLPPHSLPAMHEKPGTVKVFLRYIPRTVSVYYPHSSMSLPHDLHEVMEWH